MPNLGVPASFADIPTGLKCVKVYIPNGTDIHLYALRGQLSNLGKAWWWDTGGDVDLARTIAGWWVAASEATDLTALCEDCDMVECNVNVNVNCGCGGGVPTTILCYDQDGNPVITPQPPVEPTVPNPVGDSWPINPTEDTAPDAFGDWTTFDVEACAAANGLWQAAYAMVTWAEGGIDLIATVAVVVAFLVPGIGTAIVAALGGTAIVSLASILVKIILSEQASDILSECRLWLETNKEEIICTIFHYRYDIPTMQLELVRMWFAWVDVALDLSDVDQDIVREWGRAIFPLNLLLAYFFEYQRYIEASSPVDCSLCVSGITFDFSVLKGTLLDQSGQPVINGQPVAYSEVYSIASSEYARPGVDPFGWSFATSGMVNFVLVDSIGDYVPYPDTSDEFAAGRPYKQPEIIHNGEGIVIGHDHTDTVFDGVGAPGTSAVDVWKVYFMLRPVI